MIALRKEHLPHVLWVPIFLAVFAPTLSFLWFHWTRNVWRNGHGIFVPVLVAFIAHHAFARVREEEEEPSAWGFVIVGFGLLLLALDSAIKTELLAAVSMLLCLPGLALLTLGPRKAQALLFPWLLSFMMLPIPNAFLGPVHLFMRQITTQATSFLIGLFNIPHYVVGTTIDLPRGPIQVVDECSGFSALFAAVTIALVLFYMSRSRAQRVFLALAPFPFAMFCNILRVAAMVLIANQWGYEILDTWIHPFLGWVSFVGTLVLLFVLSDVVERRWTPA